MYTQKDTYMYIYIHILFIFIYIRRTCGLVVSIPVVGVRKPNMYVHTYEYIHVYTHIILFIYIHICGICGCVVSSPAVREA